MSTVSATRPASAEVLAAALAEARARTLDMLASFDDTDLRRQHSVLMSPLVWDLAHVGNYEDQWLIGAVAGSEARIGADLDQLYDAFLHPRSDRPALPILPPDAARAYIGQVRDRALDVLGTVRFDADRDLLAGGFVYGMVVQHEHQHDETMLATIQLREGGYPPAVRSASGLPDAGELGAAATRDEATAGEVLVPAGPFVMGTDTDPWAYDNERPAHVVELDAYWIDAAPVSNAAFSQFIADGGYERSELWTEAGWAWRHEANLSAPQFWFRDGTGWSRVRFGVAEPVPAAEPVQHVCWYEADAYARWAGRRLPTEAEWEKAASWGPDGVKRRMPWGNGDPAGRANLWRPSPSFAPAPIGSLPGGVSPFGCHQLVGDVWEWTSSDFTPYPGFRAFPYREYSEVFFPPPAPPGGSPTGDYKVLRGGSWAAHPSAVRATFRNWDYPIRRQIFSGFRCARDAEEDRV